jgi:hypothetical protein
MLGWIKKQVSNFSTASTRRDIGLFNERTRDADEQEIARLLVVANSLRLHLTETGQIPAAALDLSIPRDAALELACDQCAECLKDFINETQKDSIPAFSVGCTIWLYSVRALNDPKLADIGRNMWAELARGFPGTDAALAELLKLHPEVLHPNIETETRFIPCGLEPPLYF